MTDFPEKLSNPARRALESAGYHKLEELATVSEADLLKLHGMGRKGTVILRQALLDRGLDFKPGR